MRDKNIGCLPVVRDGRLIGLITAYDFLTVSAKLLEERLSALAETRKKVNNTKEVDREYKGKAA
jgi:CBS domain-containing protein